MQSRKILQAGKPVLEETEQKVACTGHPEIKTA
jgi:hypothetical protein